MKKMFLFCLLLITSQLFSQWSKCGDVKYKEHLFNKYQGLEERMPRPENAFSTRSNTVYKIPVVVHIVYNNNEQNLSEALIKSQIAGLNNDFRRTNADAANTRSVFKPVAGDAMIEFELAQIDPTGKPTTGITRTKTSKASFFEIDILLFLQASVKCGVDFSDPVSIEENAECLQEFFEMNGVNFDNIFDTINDVKYTDKGGIDPWDQKKYLNIWVCNMAVDLLGESTPFLLGFAYPPVGAPLWPVETLPIGYEKEDGVVIQYQVFGKNNPAIGTLQDLNGEGRTCTHEVGHYLGLRHVWGDGDCTMDDGIADTPDASDSSQEGDNSSCATLHLKNTCTESVGPELPDMIENYMDYSRESCMNMFSNGQINMMRSMLEGPRAELVGLQASTGEPIVSYTQAYPNPASQTIQFMKVNFNATITIHSLDGKIVKTVMSNSQNGQCDVSQLKNGVYIAKIQDSNSLFYSKFIKE